MKHHRHPAWIVAAVLIAATCAPAENPPAAPKPSAQLRAGTDARKGGYRARRRITADQEKELLALIEKRQPKLHTRLLEKRTASPMAYRWEMQILWGRYQRIRHLPKDVQQAALDQMEAKGAILRLVRAYRQADSDGAKVRLENALRDAIAREFDAAQTLNTHRLGQLDKQLKRMRDDLAAQARTRDTIVQSRLERAIKGGPGGKVFRRDDTLPVVEPAVMNGQARARVIFVQNDRKIEGPGPDGWRPGGRLNRQELTAAQEAELLAVLKAKSPAHYDRLVALKRDTPRQYPHFAAAMWRWYQQWKTMPPDVQGPAVTVMDRQIAIFRLARDYKRAASDAQREKIAAQLKTVIGEHFDAELKVRAHALGVFEKRVAGMHDALAGRARTRDAIIAKRLREYLSGNDKPVRKPRPHAHPELPEADGG